MLRIFFKFFKKWNLWSKYPWKFLNILVFFFPVANLNVQYKRIFLLQRYYNPACFCLPYIHKSQEKNTQKRLQTDCWKCHTSTYVQNRLLLSVDYCTKDIFLQKDNVTTFIISATEDVWSNLFLQNAGQDIWHPAEVWTGFGPGLNKILTGL